jgi:F-type H+-transporting ATPase subunit b
MEILKNFGFDPVMLGAQIINFLIILFLLKRLLYKPVLSMLRKRADAITEGINQAEKSRILLEKTIEDEKKILRKAQEQSKKIIGDANAQAVLIASEIEQNSRKQAEKILEDAKVQIVQETKEAQKKLADDISKLSIEFLSTSLKEIFGEKEEKIIIEKTIKRLRK